ncbi:hypothetical protein GB931_09380 [Modestobacter sp. I12A-02628]|uniref:Uncharacterized protein n=1 Tax=Goekera deserti TaxID=2497753 RepID=A0A7K3WK50_9ACTN|nr:hypothetical protein [Goekera deserti]MPQ98128.1 hypothetical protein [Goekera deserti]NDI48776.1 hypothetical protein [Goekera deserti]NEL56702.1 hypothetical protein [Goekera deserti]
MTDRELESMETLELLADRQAQLDLAEARRAVARGETTTREDTAAVMRRADRRSASSSVIKAPRVLRLRGQLTCPAGAAESDDVTRNRRVKRREHERSDRSQQSVR